MCCGLQLDLDRPLEGQGPFTVILHKTMDILARMFEGDPQVLSEL